jgi:hypothetical protein
MLVATLIDKEFRACIKQHIVELEEDTEDDQKIAKKSLKILNTKLSSKEKVVKQLKTPYNVMNKGDCIDKIDNNNKSSASTARFSTLTCMRFARAH